jgi:hypothetical protein
MFAKKEVAIAKRGPQKGGGEIILFALSTFLAVECIQLSSYTLLTLVQVGIYFGLSSLETAEDQRKEGKKAKGFYV